MTTWWNGSVWLGLLAWILGPLVPVAAQSLAELLPKKPRVVALETRERNAPEAEVWRVRERFYRDPAGQPVLHGVQVEHKRLKDRERYNTEYTVTHRCWYDGKPGTHQVVLTYTEGRLARIDYVVGENAAITRAFAADGSELPDPNAARGAKHKRQNVLLMFDDVYGKIDPASP